MNIKLNQQVSGVAIRHSGGMTLLDVLMAIVIFVIGMLALASLQGNLTRSTADANARTMATNIAEELIEQLRTFEKLETEAGFDAYQDIVDDTLSFDRGGISYTVDVIVEDWYFGEDRVSITDNPDDLPNGWDTTISDFKNVQLDVSWAASEFVVNADQGTTNTLGSGSLTVSTLIPSVPQLGAAKIAAKDDAALGTPPIDYTPGQRPDIVAINLTNNKFKESTTPIPDVIRTDELVETWFDVITYNTTGANSIYLRREEFLVLSCECKLKSNPANGNGSGFLPTVWNGQSYTEGAWVDKAYGESASNQQSSYCDTCCRDHHDSPSYTDSHEVYDPARLETPPIPHWSESGGLDGDHKHYTRANKGGLSLAGNNGAYVEACRMVRKDGFMRVAQDFRQERLVSIPEGFLDTASGVNKYSNYVTEAVNDYYDNDRTAMTPPGGSPADLGYNFPGDRIDASGDEDTVDTTDLPLLGVNSQQMRARGIYLDTIGPELSDFLDCIVDDTAHDDCDVPAGINDPLQALPFYDIQTTWLAWWVSDPAGSPVSVTNEEVKDDNGHSRGLAYLEVPSATGNIEVETEMHRGNIGLTVTDEITLADSSVAEAKEQNYLYIDLNEDPDGANPGGYVWSGMFRSSVNKVNASDATITPIGNTFCSRSGTDISCATPLGEDGGITISGYTYRQGQTWQDYWICVNNFVGVTVVNFPDGANNSATVSWPAGVAPLPTNAIISIEASPDDC